MATSLSTGLVEKKLTNKFNLLGRIREFNGLCQMVNESLWIITLMAVMVKSSEMKW